MQEKHEYDYAVFDNHYSLPITENASETKEQILLIATLSFAKYGYASVSMRDLAKVMGLNQSSLYNHFESKEALWKAANDHAGRLYTLYFEHLNEVLAKSASFEEVLDAIFFEPKRLLNVFTSYAFVMVQTEQFRDSDTGKLFQETYMTYAIDCLKICFDRCIERGMVDGFDTRTVATIIMHSVHMGLQVEVHHQLNNSYAFPYEPRKMFRDLQQFILRSVARPARTDFKQGEADS